MDIFFAEVKKIFFQKLIWFLIALALIINVFIICSNLYYRDKIAYINEIASKTGIVINVDTLDKLQKLSDEKYKKLCKIYKNLTGKELTGMNDFSYQYIDKATSKDVQESNLLTNLIDSSKNIYYNSKIISSDDLLNQRLDRLESEPLRSVLKWQYKALDTRLQSMDTSGERMYISQSIVMKMHSFLFSTILFFFYIEMIVIAAILTFKSVGNELSEGTQSVVYATKRGRNLQSYKLIACFFAIVILFVAVGLITLLLYFIIYPQWEFFNMPICADMYGGIISKVPFTLIQYLLANLGYGLLLILIFSAISYIIGLCVKNTYIGILVFFVLQMVCLIIGMNAYIENTSLSKVVAIFTPITTIFAINMDKIVLRNCAAWFTLTNAATSLPFFEFIVAAIWIALCTVFGKVAKRYFNRMEL